MFDDLAGRRVHAAEPLTDGYRHSNYLLRTDDGPFVLRMYRHDPALCRKELDLHRLVGATVPVPELVRADPSGDPPFALFRYVEGITFRELRRSGDAEASAQAAHSAGETLAAIHRFTFDRPGWIGPGAVVTEDPPRIPEFVEERIDDARVRPIVRSAAGELAAMSRQTRLAHGDFNQRNVIVRRHGGRWRVAAVLDWEFAVSGTPLMDIGNFLRYHELPIASGYREAGGVLPHDWRRLSMLVDLAGLASVLSDPETPAEARAEATVILERYLARLS
jgi:aminoglycoside phosphotransferase (APT) family kinase protein